LAVFDSMNHGAKSALALSLLRAEMERCVNLTAQPSQCLDWMNSELLALGIADLYISACVATWFPETQLLVYATAGLYPPIVIRNGQDLGVADTASGIPLGIQTAEHYE